MGMEMGIPNFNFQRLPKNFMNMNANQPRKSKQETFVSKYKDKYINESLLDFSKSEKNSLLEELVNNIIDFRKKCVHKKENDNKIMDTIISNYLLFHTVEKNLIEISYLSQREHRDNKIEILYKWYKNILNKNNILKRMKSKSYKSNNEKYDFSEEKKENENEEINNIKEDNKENIENNEEDNTNIKKEEKEEELIQKKEQEKDIIPAKVIKNKLSESFSRKERLRLASAKEQKSDLIINSKSNPSWNFMTRLHIKKTCANNNSLPRTNSEIFTSSFITPKPCKKIFFPVIKDKHFKIEEDIMNSKLRQIQEKRNWEDVNIHLNKFGMIRAKFKENVNNKYEMKELIKMYVNENKNETEINNSKLLKKYLKKKIKIKNVYNKSLSSNSTNFNKTLDKNKETSLIKNININKGTNIKNERVFYGINHIKIILDKIKNINQDNKKIIDNENNNIQTFDIKMKICGNIIKMSNLLSKSTGDKSFTIKETSNEIISSDLLFKEKMINKNKSFEVIKKEDIYKTDLNNSLESNNLEEEEEEKEQEEEENKKEEKKEDEYNFDENYYYNLEQEEEKKKHVNYNLSLFHLNNYKKIPINRKKNRNANVFKKFRFKPLNLNEKKKLDIYNNFIHNKSDFLSIRKNMEIINKFDYKQINDKNSNIFFHHSCRYDNIDEDDKIKDNNIEEEETNKKNENKLQKRFCLSKALFEPKSNNNFNSMYYFPRPGSKLLIRKLN